VLAVGTCSFWTSPLQASLGVETTTHALQHAHTAPQRASIQYKPPRLAACSLTPIFWELPWFLCPKNQMKVHFPAYASLELSTDKVTQPLKLLPRPTSPRRASVDGQSSEMARPSSSSLPRRIPPSSKTRMRRGACGRRP
jgi:hypothetical protein